MASGLKSGKYIDDAGAANDTAIPEFVDRFPDAMPILYLRCKKSVDMITTGQTAASNSVITFTPGFDSTAPNANRTGPYDLSQIIGYTLPPIGVGACTVKAGDYVPSVPAPLPHGIGGTGTILVTSSMSKTPPTGFTYQYPYDAYSYFQNPTSQNTPRQKDSYILIAPGKDRTYGTDDDICNFGDVKP